MNAKKLKQKLRQWHQELNGATTEYDLSAYIKITSAIHKMHNSLQDCSDDELRRRIGKIRSEAMNQEDCDNILVEVFALVFEIVLRCLQLRPFDEQLIAGIAMHQGKIAEMQTGEGKTLAAVFPACLHALAGKGVHVLTFNDYLAHRDAQWMGPVYDYCGLRVGEVHEGMSTAERQKAYKADITYLTAKEAGFDFLRDSLCLCVEDFVQRPFHFAIIDEADSILIDEARIPLVIAGSTGDNVLEYRYMVEIVQQLQPGEDFLFDEYKRNFHLTEHGVHTVEELLPCDNIYAAEHIDVLTRLNCAIHAVFLLHRDVDYIVRDGRIELVDNFTGRVAEKRRWPDGLQAALEAKEAIQNQAGGEVLNSIALQHFLQRYPQIAGMTATAQTSAEELRYFYDLTTVVIPPHKPCPRIDHPDKLFPTKAAKLDALVQEIIDTHKTGRPVLVGTGNVEESENLAGKLSDHGIQCAVLNAKNDVLEAEIIARAGQLASVTISTNMAGRGVDIQLGPTSEEERRLVLELGGLYVIGTTRHESERIDRQLRGRAGRQGDPGASRFFISLEDDIFVRYQLKEIVPGNLDRINTRSSEKLQKYIHLIQKIIEGQNLEIKKTLVRYSELIDKQRQVLYLRRRAVLEGQIDLQFWQENSAEQYAFLVARTGIEQMTNACRQIEIFCIDNLWREHLAKLADRRDGIHLLRLGGQDPAFEFQKIAVNLFAHLLEVLETEMLKIFNALQVKAGGIDLERAGVKTPSATWTYLINDNPFENMFGVALIGNAGISLSIGAVMWTPLLAIYLLWKKLKRVTMQTRS